MAEAASDIEEVPGEPVSGRGRRWRGALLVLAVLVMALSAGIWFSRERIAGNFIERELDRYDIPATYTIERIAPGRQVLTNVVVGDPRAPDLTIERAEIAVVYRFGRPRLGRITLARPRLFGTWRGGKLSFGTLDKALFRRTDEPPGLPKLDLKLIDGRALIESDFGPVGLKVEGAGRIDDGFKGIVALAAPRLLSGECSARGASFYGALRTAGGKLSLEGPLRMNRLGCRSVAVANTIVGLDATIDADLAGVEGEGRLRSGAFAIEGVSANGLTGSFRGVWRDGSGTGRYSLAARGVAHPQARAALLTGEGRVRARGGLRAIDVEADLEGNGLRMGTGFDGALANFATSTRGTLLAPLVNQARTALARESRASNIAATLVVRRTAAATTILVPRATLRGGSGATILALSRGQYIAGGKSAGRFLGNVATGGFGLPRIAGRIELSPSGRSVMRLRMAEYVAGANRLAIPDLILSQAAGGTLGFAGTIQATGAVPGGSAQGLRLPLDGSWSRGGGLTIWRRCTVARFDRLSIASLALERRQLTLCPGRGGAIVRADGGGLRIAAGAPSLDLVGRLAQTPIRLRTGPVGMAYPGAMSARAVDVALGPAATASTFRISNLTATFGRGVAGRFDNADVRLFNVPLSIQEASGAWRYAGGTLSLADSAFRLADRDPAPRFNPLVSDNGQLTLRDNMIRAEATLLEPQTRRAVTDVTLVHSLASGSGHAELAVASLLFDRQLQPVTLTPRARGVVANAAGTVSGTGRIEWSGGGVTSHGRFSSESLDFAAAFGPVKGASGTVHFTDLLALTTAPDQRIRIGSVNPGIEVTDGELVFALRGGQVLSVGGARWPFMGGTLTLRSVSLNLGTSEERRYVFEIEGLEAARFVERMELPNISATGVFDGTLPIVFDTSGNGRIEGGLLIARAPGGNVSYLGELTREDLGTMANFAFDALRSLDYQQMSIAMDGNLTGEIVTRVRFDGVKQGAGAKRNFLTKRFENLPIRFNVNIRAPFYQLITSMKAMYDPASVRDPREIGLVDREGRMIRREVNPAPPAIRPDDIVPDMPLIQTPESEKNP